MSEVKAGVKPERLVISRVFAAPREVVFSAWSTAAHLRNWFSPETCSVPEARVDFRPGGVFELCMQLPDGEKHWQRGHFTEIVAPERLAFTAAVEAKGAVRFTAVTQVSFAAEHGCTRMVVEQDYDIIDAAYRYAPEGAGEGWRTTLDKLEREIAEMTAKRNAVHDVFTLERVYAAPPAAVFRALTVKEAKAKWFKGGDEQTILVHEMDVRPGGRERLQGRWAKGTVTTFDAVYLDVIADARLIYAYEMHIDERKISVSLATVSLAPEGAGTRLTVTEQGTFIDGYEDNGSRKEGTGFLLDRMGESLKG